MEPISIGNLGTDLTTYQANQLKGINEQINVGAKAPMICTLERKIWETIPEQHFEEIRRLGKITGVKPTFHSPILDTVGFEKGVGISEEKRRAEERILEDVIIKAHRAVPDYAVPISVHSEALGAAVKRVKEWTDPKTGKKYEDFILQDWAIDQKSGQILPLNVEVRKVPAKEAGKVWEYELWDVNKKIQSANFSLWQSEVERLGAAMARIKEIEKLETELPPEQQAGLEGYKETLLSHIESAIPELFDSIERFKPPVAKKWEELNEFEKSIFKNKKELFEQAKKEFEKKKKKALEEWQKFHRIHKDIQEKMKRASMEEKQRLAALETRAFERTLWEWNKFFGETVHNPAFRPERIVPFRQIEIEQAAKTFGEAAVKSFEVAKGDLSKAPIIAIENPPADQFGLARAEELNQLIKKAREIAAKKIQEKFRISKEKAQKAAEHIIGLTWDIGHINLLRQFGYKEEDLIKETKKVAPHVKFLHLTDNFGTADSHLVPGQGNIPIEAMLKELQKAGFKGPAALEVGGFISAYKTSPWPYVLEHIDSPIYEMEAAPTWGHAVHSYFFGSSGYPVGYGTILPQYHIEEWGAGFSELPLALGAPKPGGERSKFSGAPMA